MSTVTGSRNLLENCSALEYILLGDLRDLLEEQPPDNETCRWLVVVLDALLETLPREFGLKDKEGYLAEVLELFPNWSGEVNRLHNQQSSIYQDLKELRDRIVAEANFEVIAAEIRTGLRDWMLTLIAHHRHENRLIQTAMNLEVGCGD